MQDDAEERFIDVKAAIVFNETQFPKLVHEKIDT
jgi:hypothetical protein